MKNELILKHEGDTAKLEIREGAALPLKEPTQVLIVGIINTILLWLQKRVSEITQKTCYILVDKFRLTMTLIVDETSFYKTTIVSKLELSDEYKAFGINNDEKTWECFKLADFIKMNRSFFQDRLTAMNVVTELRNFKAKIATEMDKFKDDRANKEFRLKQTVESNLPVDLKVKIPVFKGQPAISLTLEISIDTDDYGCSFICPEATDFIHEQTDAIFDEQIKQIQEIAPDIAILYV